MNKIVRTLNNLLVGSLILIPAAFALDTTTPSYNLNSIYNGEKMSVSDAGGYGWGSVPGIVNNVGSFKVFDFRNGVSRLIVLPDQLSLSPSVSSGPYTLVKKYSVVVAPINQSDLCLVYNNKSYCFDRSSSVFDFIQEGFFNEQDLSVVWYKHQQGSGATISRISVKDILAGRFDKKVSERLGFNYSKGHKVYTSYINNQWVHFLARGNSNQVTYVYLNPDGVSLGIKTLSIPVGRVYEIDISSNQLVWKDYDKSIYYCDFNLSDSVLCAQPERISYADNTSSSLPQIEGNNILWIDEKQNLSLYEISTKKVFVIAKQVRYFDLEDGMLFYNVGNNSRSTNFLRDLNNSPTRFLGLRMKLFESSLGNVGISK